MSTFAGPPGDDARFARVCRDHGLELKALTEVDDRLFCPSGRGHSVDHWHVVDRSKGLKVSEVSREAGEVAQMRERVPPLPARDETPPPVKTKKVVARHKFTNGAGEVLWLRLLIVPTPFGGDPYRIAWQHLVPVAGKKDKSTQGGAATAPTTALAAERLKTAVAKATDLDWRPAPISTGRAFEILPIPAPTKKAR